MTDVFIIQFRDLAKVHSAWLKQFVKPQDMKEVEDELVEEE
jgi:hypothetical protein